MPPTPSLPPPPKSDLRQLFALLFLFHSLRSRLAAAHQGSSSYAAAALTEWRSAHASYYAASDPRDTFGPLRSQSPSFPLFAPPVSVDGSHWFSGRQGARAGTAT